MKIQRVLVGLEPTVSPRPNKKTDKHYQEKQVKVDRKIKMERVDRLNWRRRKWMEER